MRQFKNTRLANTVLGSAIGVLIGVGSAFGNPLDPNVIAGTASFDTQGSELNVTNSSGAIIDWNSFSIAQNEITRFIQESSSSAVLNRVTGGNLSEILGELQSNGRVFLINPNGLIVGEGAVIDAAGFVGSTLDISNQSFASGDYSFSGTEGTIENHGLIHVTGNGDIALIATSVENSGVLRSDNGNILLAAGKSISLSFDDFQDIRFEVQAPEDRAVNLGDIIAGGGNASILGGEVSSSGNVEIVEGSDGRIFLHAIDTAIVSGSLKSNGGDIHIESDQVELSNVTIDADSDAAAGNIWLLGDNVGLFAGTKVSASGNGGGGTILVGGEQQGQGDTRTSEFVYLDSDAIVNADGGTSGDGGRVILFAKNSARVYGAVTARGGKHLGDGGFIETSGLLGLDVRVTPDAGASNGIAGNWLIDPNDITIVDAGGSDVGIDATPVSFPEVFTAVASGATITSQTIVDALNNNNVTIDTGSTGTDNGDIFITDSINFVSNNTFTLNAARDIVFSPGVSVIGNDGFISSGSLVFNSDNNNNGVGTTRLADTVTIEAGLISFNGGGVTADGVIDSLELRGMQLDVAGGFEINDSEISLDFDTADIDEINLTGGDNTGGAIFAGPGSVFTVGTLNITHAAPGTMPSQATVLDSGTYYLTDGGSFDLTATTGGSPLPGAQVEIAADIVNEGVLDISGEGALDVGFLFGVPDFGSFTNDIGATLNVTSGAIIGSNQAIVNDGTFNVLGALIGPPVEIFADLQNSGVINVGLDAGLFVDSVENSGLVDIDAGGLLLTSSFILNSGEIHLVGGGILDLFDDSPTPVPIDLTVGDGSSITGDGIIQTDGTVFVESGGIIAPGNSPGAIAIAGGLTLYDGAILDIELSGANPGEFDFIDVMGDLNVGGPGSTPASTPGVVLNVSNLGGYDPDPAFSHDVIQVGGSIFQSATPFNQSVTGFDTLTVNVTGNTLELLVSITPPVVTPPPPPPPPPAPPPAPPPPPPPPPPAPPPPDPEIPPETPPQTPPKDIINDVFAFDPIRSEFGQSITPSPSTDRYDSEEDEEPRSFANECR